MARVNPNRINVVQPSSTSKQIHGGFIEPSKMTPITSPKITYPSAQAASGQNARSRQMSLSLPPFKPLPSSNKANPIITPTKKTFYPYAIPEQNFPAIITPTPQYGGQLSPQQIAQMVTQMTAAQLNQNQFSQSVNIRNVSGTLLVDNSVFDRKKNDISRISAGSSIATDKMLATSAPGGLVVVPSPLHQNSVQLPMTGYNRGHVYGADSSLSLKKLDASPSPVYMPTVSEFVESEVQHGYVSPDEIVLGTNKPFLPTPVQSNDDMVNYNTIPSASSNDIQSELMQKISAISRATNISVEAIQTAIMMRQQQLASQSNTPPPPTTTRRPVVSTASRHKRPQTPGAAKVMNAPREYYPVGYDKNFDDNFESKVDLPDTSFHCGDQKHFPGLYGDEDLGCMVFHVCALTDEGLIMKSFLCPESTLFDQTILKCNWWFYVDCKTTKKTYDSNIPISKSYQLMKALTFFSSYKKDQLGVQQLTDNLARGTDSESMNGINQALQILHSQNNVETKKVEVAERPPKVSVSQTTPRGQLQREVPKLSVSSHHRTNKGLETVSAKQVSFLLASVEDNSRNKAAAEHNEKSTDKALDHNTRSPPTLGSTESRENTDKKYSNENSNNLRKRKISSRFSVNKTQSNNSSEDKVDIKKNNLIENNENKHKTNVINTTPKSDVLTDSSTVFTITVEDLDISNETRSTRVSRASKEDFSEIQPQITNKRKLQEELNQNAITKDSKINNNISEDEPAPRSIQPTSKGEIRVLPEESSKSSEEQVLIVLPVNQN